MHHCFTVQDWIRAWTTVEIGDSRLSPNCRPNELADDPLARPNEVWGSPELRRMLEATPGVPAEVVECRRCMAEGDELEAILEELEHFDPAVAAESLDADRLFRTLAAHPAQEQARLVAADGRFRTWSLCQRFLAEAERLWHHDPALAQARAATGVAIAAALDEETYHPRWVEDLRAKARAYLGNSLRVLTRFAKAEQELHKASEHLHRGVESGQREARILSFRSSLLIDQGLNSEAEELLARVERYYSETDQRVELARTQIKRAVALANQEAFRAAAEECAKAYGNLDPRRHSRLSLVACQNAVAYLVQAGDVGRARGLFSTLPPTSERMLLLRRRWIEAELLRAEGRFDQAMEAYDDARRGYAEEGIPYDVAIISLDQATAAYEVGDLDAMRELARDAGTLLGEAGARHEALAVLRVLRSAIEQGTVTRSVLTAIRKRVAETRPSR